MTDARPAGARPARAAPRARLSPLELRLYLAALLGAVYTVSWRAITGGAAPPAATAPPPPPAAALAPAAAVWLDDLPPAQRPPVAPPAGWRLAARGEPAIAPAPRVVRAPASRPLRVRTRSS